MLWVLAEILNPSVSACRASLAVDNVLDICVLGSPKVHTQRVVELNALALWSNDGGRSADVMVSEERVDSDTETLMRIYGRRNSVSSISTLSEIDINIVRKLGLIHDSEPVLSVPLNKVLESML